MKIIIAKSNSFCSGVQKAFDRVRDKFSREVEKGANCILGSLAHNPSVEKKILDWGIKKINNINKIKDGQMVIITAHGCAEKTLQKIKEKGGKIFDTTCPNVKKIHNLVKRYSKEGYEVLIFGDKEHKEVIGIKGWCKKHPTVFNSITDAKNTFKELAGKIRDKSRFILVSQTTQNIKKYERIKEIFKDWSKQNELKAHIFDTICHSCQFRQNEAESLARKCQAVLVVGGGNSANTKRLWQKARDFNENVYWIKNIYSNQLEKIKEKLSNKKIKSLALLSGASTPKWEIQAVIKRISE